MFGYIGHTKYAKLPNIPANNASYKPESNEV